MADGRNVPRVHLGIPPLHFIVIRPKRHICKSVQQIRDKTLPIFFGKFFCLSLNVYQLNHGPRISAKPAMRNQELRSI